MFKEEIKKMFLHKKLYVLLIFVLIYQAFILSNPNYNVFLEEEYNQHYETLLETIEGPYNSDKESFIMNLYQVDSSNYFDKEDALMSTNKSDFNRDDYLARVINTKNTDLKYTVSSFLKSQLTYVSEDTVNRSFINANAWMTYDVDISIIIFVIILSIVIIDLEESTGMDQLNASTFLGKRKSDKTKVILLILSSFLLVFFSNFLRLLIINPGSYGAHASSLPLYSNTPFNFSLLSMYALNTLVNFIGLTFVGLFVMYVTKKSKSWIAGLVFAVLIVWTPFILYSFQDRFKLPYPLSLIYSNLFMSGSGYNKTQLLFIITIYLVISLILLKLLVNPKGKLLFFCLFIGATNGRTIDDIVANDDYIIYKSSNDTHHIFSSKHNIEMEIPNYYGVYKGQEEFSVHSYSIDDHAFYQVDYSLNYISKVDLSSFSGRKFYVEKEDSKRYNEQNLYVIEDPLYPTHISGRVYKIHEDNVYSINYDKHLEKNGKVLADREILRNNFSLMGDSLFIVDQELNLYHDENLLVKNNALSVYVKDNSLYYQNATTLDLVRIDLETNTETVYPIKTSVESIEYFEGKEYIVGSDYTMTVLENTHILEVKDGVFGIVLSGGKLYYHQGEAKLEVITD